jgi:hypothetical protein
MNLWALRGRTPKFPSLLQESPMYREANQMIGLTNKLVLAKIRIAILANTELGFNR